MPADFILIERDWNAVIQAAARPAGRALRIICPFIKFGALAKLLQAARPSTIQVITRFNLSDFYAGVSDISALRHLLQSGAEVKGVRNLHAKLYLFGSDQAIATSANLTEAALGRNHEFGFRASNPDIMAKCQAYFNSMWIRADPLLIARS